MTPRLMTDTVLKSLLEEELKWAPGVDSVHIGVGVTDGTVTLSGEVDSYPEKRLAEKAAQRVKGVHAVAEEITVRTTHASNDGDVARAVGVALESAVDVDADLLTAIVEDHVVTLEGTVAHQHQREAVTRAVRYLPGVRDVRNKIVLAPPASATDLRAGIRDALVRHAVLDAQRCIVTIGEQGEVTIEGTVGTSAEKVAVGRVAWAAEGVTAVSNRLEVTS